MYTSTIDVVNLDLYHFIVNEFEPIMYRWISLSRSSQDRCKILSYPKF